MAWLNPKGHREVALKSVLTKWWPHITSGLRRRVAVSPSPFTISYSLILSFVI